MASVQNRANPLGEYGEIRTSRIRTTDSILSGTTWSGSTILTLTGSRHIQGLVAQGKIYRYQPVVFASNATTILTVSGASSWGQGGIVGVSAGHVADGGAVSIITEGIVPYCQSSSASIPTTGSYVIFAASGSWFTGSSTYGFVPAVAPATSAPGLSSGSGVIGTVASIDATGNFQVWVQPHVLVAS